MVVLLGCAFMLTVVCAECRKIVLCAECHYAKCHYAGCRYAECLVFFRNFLTSLFSKIGTHQTF
jgi:hypothetical protein